MTAKIPPSDFVWLAENFSGRNIECDCSEGILNITAKVIDILNAKMEFTGETANGNLMIDLHKGLVDGLNFTDEVREKLFNTLKQYNNDHYSFSLDGTQIVLNMKGIGFNQVTINDSVNIFAQIE